MINYYFYNGKRLYPAQTKDSQDVAMSFFLSEDMASMDLVAYLLGSWLLTAELGVEAFTVDVVVEWIYEQKPELRNLPLEWVLEIISK